MADDDINLVWKPPGPVSARFMASNSRIQIINGPVGGGKTTTMFIKGIRIAMKQKISPGQSLTVDDGTTQPQPRPVRKVKIACIRDTYRQLWRSTIPSWNKRFPQSVGQWNGSKDGPVEHRVPMVLADGSVLDLIKQFGAIGDNDIEEFMRGYEPTFWELNEGDLLARECFNFAKGRWGRYPDMSEGGPTWHGILMDCNAPQFNNWLYRDIFSKSPEELAALDTELFMQPSGFSAEAENVENLPLDYYTDQAKGQPEWYIQRMIENRPGYSRAGKPIYPEFRDRFHVSRITLNPVPGLPIKVGLDAGGTPAGVIGQRMPNGQWRILDEIVTENGAVTGALRFADMLARKLKERYAGWKDIQCWADPSAAYGADKHAGEASWIEIVAKAAAVSVRAGPTNKVIPRWEAVRRPLTQVIDGEPGFLLSPHCKTLREGFNTGYQFRKLQIGHEERYAEEADKNEYSHPHDALQYLMSGGGEDNEIRGRRDDDWNRLRSYQSGGDSSDHDWNPTP